MRRCKKDGGGGWGAVFVVSGRWAGDLGWVAALVSLFLFDQRGAEKKVDGKQHTISVIWNGDN